MLKGKYFPSHLYFLNSDLADGNLISIQSEQLMVTFAAGYIAGVFCAIVSHPADSVVSVINKNPGRTAGDSEYKFMGGTNIMKNF